MRIRGAIFDVDGTVLDSMPAWDNVAQDYLTLNGFTPKDGLIEDLRTLGGHQVGAYFIDKYGMKKTPDEITDGINSLLEDFYFHAAMPKPGVLRVLDTLKRGGVKMCVATATDRYLVEAALERTGLLRYFGHVFTCSELQSGKGEPRMFLRAAEFLGTDVPDTLVFEGRRDTEVHLLPDTGHCAVSKSGETIPLMVGWLTGQLGTTAA